VKNCYSFIFTLEKRLKIVKKRNVTTILVEIVNFCFFYFHQFLSVFIQFLKFRNGKYALFIYSDKKIVKITKICFLCNANLDMAFAALITGVGYAIFTPVFFLKISVQRH